MIDLYLFADCETASLPKEMVYPHLVQIGCRLVTGDRRCVGVLSRIVRPDGFSIEAGAEAVHGISERLAHQVGADLWMVLAEFRAFVQAAQTIVGFNITSFDQGVIVQACRDAQVDATWWHKRSGSIVDVMEMAATAMGEGKFPKLTEAVNRFVGPWTQRHDALDDAEATERLFWALKDRTDGHPHPAS